MSWLLTDAITQFNLEVSINKIYSYRLKIFCYVYNKHFKAIPLTFAVIITKSLNLLATDFFSNFSALCI
jgi:hypothetical protein